MEPHRLRGGYDAARGSYIAFCPKTGEEAGADKAGARYRCLACGAVFDGKTGERMNTALTGDEKMRAAVGAGARAYGEKRNATIAGIPGGKKVAFVECLTCDEGISEAQVAQHERQGHKVEIVMKNASDKAAFKAEREQQEKILRDLTSQLHDMEKETGAGGRASDPNRAYVLQKIDAAEKARDEAHRKYIDAHEAQNANSEAAAKWSAATPEQRVNWTMKAGIGDTPDRIQDLTEPHRSRLEKIVLQGG